MPHGEGYDSSFSREQPVLEEGTSFESKEAKAKVFLDVFGIRIDPKLKAATQDVLGGTRLIKSIDSRKRGVYIRIEFEGQDVLVSRGKR